MKKNRKKRLEILNQNGIYSQTQISKLKTLEPLTQLPPVTDEMLKREYHELTFKEFESMFILSALKKKSPASFLKKTTKEIIAQISLHSLKFYVRDSVAECRSHYTEIINEALKEKKQGIAIETLKDIQFKAESLKSVKAYCRHFGIDL